MASLFLILIITNKRTEDERERERKRGKKCDFASHSVSTRENSSSGVMSRLTFVVLLSFMKKKRETAGKVACAYSDLQILGTQFSAAEFLCSKDFGRINFVATANTKRL